MIVFVDTSAFAGLENRRDETHEAATREYRRLIRNKAQLVTSDYVFDEVITLLKVRAGAEVALRWGRRLLSSSLFELVFVDRAIMEDALDIFEGAFDQPFSFTDCSSVALMRSRLIDAAFVFDEDFRRFGFRQLPARRR